jgi:hypothetical protein
VRHIDESRGQPAPPWVYSTRCNSGPRAAGLKCGPGWRRFRGQITAYYCLGPPSYLRPGRVAVLKDSIAESSAQNILVCGDYGSRSHHAAQASGSFQGQPSRCRRRFKATGPRLINPVDLCSALPVRHASPERIAANPCSYSYQAGDGGSLCINRCLGGFQGITDRRPALGKARSKNVQLWVMG